MNKEEYLKMVAPVIVNVAKEKGYKYPSAIIAQSIIESAWGKSELANKYFNYFGMKCGSRWSGKSVNLSTKEEYTVGTLTAIKDNFRVFDNLESGIRGYFDFISSSRYSELKTATSSKNYLELIKKAGYATSSKYVENVYRIVTDNNLLVYDSENVSRETLTEDEAITVIAKEVIAGKYGIGHENRKNAIYEKIRKMVNELC